MKTVAYSQVPQTHSYVHLAYLSASSGPGEIALPAAFLGAVAYLLIYLIGHTAKLNVKYPRPWRVMTLAVLTVTGFLAIYGLLLGFTLTAG